MDYLAVFTYGETWLTLALFIIAIVALPKTEKDMQEVSDAFDWLAKKLGALE